VLNHSQEAAHGDLVGRDVLAARQVGEDLDPRRLSLALGLETGVPLASALAGQWIRVAFDLDRNP
jgi:hypothetical protein